MEAKENKRFILHFPSAGDAQALPREQGFRTKKQLLQKTNIVSNKCPPSFSILLSFYC